MTIRVVRNDAGNCVTFVGSTQPAYWNACLSAQVNAEDNDRIDVINDVRTTDPTNPEFEFYAIPFTEFVDADNAAFANAQDAADYITEKAHVIGSTGSFVAGPTDVLDFVRDATNTTILVDNGDAFAVNSIQAVGTDDGLITIKEMGDNGATLYSGVYPANVQITGSSTATTQSAVVNQLNALFSVNPIGAGGTDELPVFPTDDAVSITTSKAEGVDPLAFGIYGVGSDTGSGHGARVWATGTDVINEVGEYYTVKIGGKGRFILGLVDMNNATDVAELSNDTGSGHSGLQWGNAFYNYGTYTAPWTTYGTNSGLSYGPGWSFYGNDPMFRYNTEVQLDLRGDDNTVPVGALFKVGFTTGGHVAVYYYDLGRTNTWIMTARSSYTLPQSDYALVVKLWDGTTAIMEEPKLYKLEESAPVLNYRYIESPNGSFYYPLFATAEEANYVDAQNGGSGTGASHTHTFVDDLTGTTWYMPDNGGTEAGSSAPSNTADITYVGITTDDDSNYTPPQFSNTDVSHAEGTVINMQLRPAGATWSQSVDVSPTGSGLVYDNVSGLLQGTLNDVATNTAYTVTVTRANAFGSSVGSFTITATDVPPVQTNDTPWTKALDFSGNAEHLKQVTTSSGSNALRMTGQSVVVSANSDTTKTAGDLYSRPWATAVVFRSDRNNSNQHIWNSGEGANGDNIYIRQSSTGDLYFGWGRDGALNECAIGNVSTTTGWHGIYIASNGTRLSGSDATAANLADAISIRRMSSEWAQPFGTLGSELSTSGNWATTGGRMDRAVLGDFTIGGRGSNRSFHGKVASMVVTGLRRDYSMPTDAEIELMIADPLKWEDDYRVGQTVRRNNSGANTTYDVTNGKYGTQIWLMGDGTSDSYSNGIRNEVDPTDQNYVRLQLNSMVANDIQTVNIIGLT